MEFLVQHISGYFFADKHFTSLASFATRYSEADADKVIAEDPAYRRKLKIEAVQPFPAEYYAQDFSLCPEFVDRSAAA